jgi:hypothetical protein
MRLISECKCSASPLSRFIHRFVQKCDELRGNISENSDRFEKCIAAHVSLADIVSRRHKHIEQAGQPVPEVTTESSAADSKVAPQRTRAVRKPRNPIGKRKQASSKAVALSVASSAASATIDEMPVVEVDAADTVVAESLDIVGTSTVVESEPPPLQANEQPVKTDDDRLALVYKSKSASQSKREIYAKAGLKMDTADDYAPILGTLYQNEFELVQYR